MKKPGYLGLDVHKISITISLIVGNSKEEEFSKKIANDTKRLLKIVKKLSEKYNLRICYEASGCGYSIYRCLTNHGYDCIIAAPSLIPVENKKVKTDRRDAKKLATFLRASLLTAITVPDEELERDRELIRFRAYQVKSLTSVKQQMFAFLLRKGIDTSEYKCFSQKFLNWLSTLELSEIDRKSLNRLIHHYDYQNKLVGELMQEIEELSKTERYQTMCSYLKAFRGIETLTAMTLITHIADFRAFPNPRKLMSFLGLTSKEDSSGEKTKRSGITKMGSNVLRKAMITVAQQYISKRTTGASIRNRRDAVPSEIIALAERADRRCFKKYFRLTFVGKHTNVAKTAVARELIGFIWEAMMYYYQGELSIA